MLRKNSLYLLLAGMLSMALVGCESMPGTRQQQATVIGGAAGAAAGAAVGGSDHRVLGAIIGGVLGAGGGYVLAANTGVLRDDDRRAAAQAAERAQANPATAEAARAAATADINNDGFVTMDEVVAMSDAGLNDGEMIRRMEATQQVFDLTIEQEQHLVQQGVSRNVVNQMSDINRDLLAEETRRQDVISQEPRVYGAP
jgi:hypothetical protein